MSSPRSLLARLVVLPLLALALVACGSDDPDSSSAEATDAASSTSPDGEEPSEPTATAPADAPECADIWRAGGAVPRGYDGCVDPSGEYVPGEALACSSGQRLVRYADAYYGVMGGTVHESSTSLDDDREYRAAVRSCRA